MSCNSSSYDPSSMVESFHDIPHVDIDLNDSPDEFDTDREYFEVRTWGASYTSKNHGRKAAP